MFKIRSNIRIFLLFILLAVLLTAPSCSYIPETIIAAPPPTSNLPQPVINYTYSVVHTYPHDPNAFTEGLAFENGFLYEGTGLNGSSSLRKVKLETGEVLQVYRLPDQYFGEGVTIFKDNIIQLTWKSHIGFVYDKNRFNLIRQFSYPTEGWGITQDTANLIMSDGSSALYFLDPDSMKTESSIKVLDNNVPLNNLNELEFVKDKVYANVWRTNKIAIIEPSNGLVTGWIDLSGLLSSQGFTGNVDVLNGIAYDAIADRLFVTGKFWPFVFEIKLIER